MVQTPETQSPFGSLHSEVLLIAGPTAVGKTETVLLLAERLRGEIVSVDSMQVYRGMDIGTAKPSPAEQARVRHHLIDVVEISDAFDASQFVRLAQEAVSGIQGRGHLPILCGGTGLYFKALLQGLGETPPSDVGLRMQLEATPLDELLRELAQHDPVTYERIDRQNPRRIFRAIEVIRLTGKPFSQQRAAWSPTVPAMPKGMHLFGFSRPNEDLRHRIDLRVDEMFHRGLVAETEQLLKRGLSENRIAMQALGYRQVVEHLQGEHSLEDTIELVKARTRQYAKKQITWFRKQLPVQWIQIESNRSPQSLADEVVRAMAAPPL